MTSGATVRRSYVVRGEASAGLPLRLLNFFAQQNLLPETVCLRRVGGGIAMRIIEATLDEHRARIILAKMQALPDVASARFDDVPRSPDRTSDDD